MYRYDEFDHAFVRERVAQFRDQVERRLVGRADRGPVQAAAADERPLSAAPRLHAADRHPLRHADSRAAAQLAHIARNYDQRLRPLHHAPEHPVQLADAEGRAGHPRRPRRRSRCTPSRPRATASATSPPTISPAPPPTRSTTRGPMPRSCGNGRRSTRNSCSCRASSRSRSPARERDRAAMQVHDIGLQLKRDATGELGFAVYVGGGLGRTPMIGAQDPRLPAGGGPARLLGGDPARLQSATAGATTSTRRASRSWSTRSALEEIARQVEAEFEAHPSRRAARCPTTKSRASRPISRRRLRGAAGAEPPSATRARRPTPAFDRFGRAQRRRRTRCRATPS